MGLFVSTWSTISSTSLDIEDYFLMTNTNLYLAVSYKYLEDMSNYLEEMLCKEETSLLYAQDKLVQWLFYGCTSQ